MARAALIPAPHVNNHLKNSFLEACLLSYFRSLKFTKLQILAHSAAWLLAGWLIWDAWAGNLSVNPIQAATQRTGKYALIFLIASLACTPLNTLLGIRQALSARRALGIYAFLFAAVQIQMYFVSATLAALAGALLGFLFFNFNPASIYMGDAGSMFIGYILAVMTVESTFYQWSSSKTYFPLLMPVIVLAIPIYEMTTVIWVRLKKGISPFKPSKDHLSYRIASIGLSVRGAVIFIYFLTICVGIAALLLPKVNLFGSILILIQVISILSIVAVLIHYGKKGGKS